jgi:hypothetical protein
MGPFHGTNYKRLPFLFTHTGPPQVTPTRDVLQGTPTSNPLHVTSSMDPLQETPYRGHPPDDQLHSTPSI